MGRHKQSIVGDVGPYTKTIEGKFLKGTFQCEAIHGKRIEKGQVKYLVKWAGYDDPAERTWEPEDSLLADGCGSLISMFELLQSSKQKKPSREQAPPKRKREEKPHSSIDGLKKAKNGKQEKTKSVTFSSDTGASDVGGSGKTSSGNRLPERKSAAHSGATDETQVSKAIGIPANVEPEVVGSQAADAESTDSGFETTSDAIVPPSEPLVSPEASAVVRSVQIKVEQGTAATSGCSDEMGENATLFDQPTYTVMGGTVAELRSLQGKLVKIVGISFAAQIKDEEEPMILLHFSDPAAPSGKGDWVKPFKVDIVKEVLPRTLLDYLLVTVQVTRGGSESENSSLHETSQTTERFWNMVSSS